MIVTWSAAFPFQEEQNVKDNAPADKGIYLLLVQLINDKWRCIYVGQSTNIQSRLLEHLSNDENNKNFKGQSSKYICGFKYCLVEQQEARNGIEKFLYNYFKPEYNDKDPGNTPIQVNLP